MIVIIFPYIAASLCVAYFFC